MIDKLSVKYREAACTRWKKNAMETPEPRYLHSELPLQVNKNMIATEFNVNIRLKSGFGKALFYYTSDHCQ
jgi:hypothetical protein